MINLSSLSQIFPSIINIQIGSENNLHSPQSNHFEEKSFIDTKKLKKIAFFIEFKLEEFNLNIDQMDCEKITKFALEALPNQFLKINKAVNIRNIDGKKRKIKSFYLNTENNQTIIYISLKENLRELLDNNETRNKIVKCIGIIIKKNEEIKCKDIQFKPKIKFTEYLCQLGSDEFNIQECKKAIRRTTISDLAKTCRNVVQNEIWGRYASRNGLKQLIFQDQYDSDLHEIYNSLNLSVKSDKTNFYRIALDIGRALLDLHQEKNSFGFGIIHRDIKMENILCNFEKEDSNKIKILHAFLTDFDIACKENIPIQRLEKSGTIPYLSPEMCIYMFELKELHSLFKIEKIESLLSTRIDTWGLGCLLHLILYDQLPKAYLPFDELAYIRRFYSTLKQKKSKYLEKIEYLTANLENEKASLNQLKQKEASLESPSEELLIEKQESEKYISTLETLIIISRRRLERIIEKIDNLIKEKERLLEVWCQNIQELHLEKEPPKELNISPLGILLWKMLRPDPRERPTDEEYLAELERQAKNEGIFTESPEDKHLPHPKCTEP